MWTKSQENIPKNMQFFSVPYEFSSNSYSFPQDDGSHLVWCGLRLVTKCRKYCNKQALICNKLRTVSKIGGDTPSHKASVFVKLRRYKSAVQAQVVLKKSEQLSSFSRIGRG